MHYKYIRTIVKSAGIPNLNAEQFVRLMDIAYYEGALNYLKKKQSDTKNRDERHKYALEILHLEDRLAVLLNSPYHKIKPNEVLNVLLVNSR
ncbi:hypothetical protein [Sediminibacter sp. Hel_I_10]|uniref:hypothetical protein n=1 Tax=Sediminibacter sp. Hel_I_10 TaxID=1392490 RepID=UPI0004793F62|nr:hypothetical protein [Sediminibacter sp. Hel_I_10]